MASPIPARDAPDAPKYWRNETGGRLGMAVGHYLMGHSMTLQDIWYIRAYLTQWIESPAWDQNPAHDDASRAELVRLRADVRRIVDTHGLHAWLRAAEEAGFDPL